MVVFFLTFGCVSILWVHFCVVVWCCGACCADLDVTCADNEKMSEVVAVTKCEQAVTEAKERLDKKEEKLEEKEGKRDAAQAELKDHIRKHPSSIQVGDPQYGMYMTLHEAVERADVAVKDATDAVKDAWEALNKRMEELAAERAAAVELGQQVRTLFCWACS